MNYFVRTIVIILVFIPRQGFTQDDRTIELEGAHNVRHLGGIETEDGRTIRPFVLIRADALAWLSPLGCEQFRELGIKTVIDIRSDSEFENYPDPPCVTDLVTHLHIPMSSFGSEPTMRDAYIYLFRNSSESIRRFFEVLADPDNLPLLYHCQIGKDRAGILSALVLRLLNVDDEIIVTDYLISRQTGYGAEPEWIEGVLDEVDAAGGIRTYLLSIGVTDEIMERVRDNVLKEPAGISGWKSHSFRLNRSSRPAPARQSPLSCADRLRPRNN